MMRPQAGMPSRRIGIYGMGEIGRKIAARCASFESEIGYFSRSKYDLPYALPHPECYWTTSRR